MTSPPQLKQGVDLQGFEALGPGKQAQVETLLLPSQAEQLDFLGERVATASDDASAKT